MPCGVIDFGDVTRTLRVCELAVAASIAYGHEPDDPICAAAEIVRGFDAACPLDEAELEALPHLIAARAAIVAVGTEQQAALEPHNAYAQRVRAGDWAICETAAAQPTALAEAPFRLACGAPQAALAPRVPPALWPLPGVEPAPRVDLSPTGLDPVCHPGALGAHGEARWHATRELSNDEPATVTSDSTSSPRRERGARAGGRSRRARGGRRARARRRRDRRAPGRARARGGAGAEVAAGNARRPSTARRRCSAPARAGRPRRTGAARASRRPPSARPGSRSARIRARCSGCRARSRATTGCSTAAAP